MCVVMGISSILAIVTCAAAGSALCVTGSLFLVARAREFFNLPCERDSITEDMALENLQCLEIACL